MSIKIHTAKCIGCGACTEACPGSLLLLQDGKAKMRSPRDCWGCTACMKTCPAAAIEYYLGADLGGKGSCMTVERKDHRYIWRVVKSTGTVGEIVIDRRSSNKY